MKFSINRLDRISVPSDLIELEITQMINTTKLFPNIHKTDYYMCPWELPNFSAKQSSETGFISSSVYFYRFCESLLFTSCVDFSNILACFSGHAKFQADSCSQSFKMSIKTFHKFEVGSCITILTYEFW